MIKILERDRDERRGWGKRRGSTYSVRWRKMTEYTIALSFCFGFREMRDVDDGGGLGIGKPILAMAARILCSL